MLTQDAVTDEELADLEAQALEQTRKFASIGCCRVQADVPPFPIQGPLLDLAMDRSIDHSTRLRGGQYKRPR